MLGADRLLQFLESLARPQTAPLQQLAHSSRSLARRRHNPAFPPRPAFCRTGADSPAAAARAGASTTSSCCIYKSNAKPGSAGRFRIFRCARRLVQFLRLQRAGHALQRMRQAPRVIQRARCDLRLQLGHRVGEAGAEIADQLAQQAALAVHPHQSGREIEGRQAIRQIPCHDHRCAWASPAGAALPPPPASASGPAFAPAPPGPPAWPRGHPCRHPGNAAAPPHRHGRSWR